MIRRARFEAELDMAIAALLDGGSIDDILARFPHDASQLRPLLESAAAMSTGFAYTPPTDRLAAAEDRIRATVARQRRSEGSSQDRPGTPWWGRRLVVATTSIPVAVVAVVLLGAGGAATATVAVTTGLPHGLVEQVERVTPDWHSFVPGEEGAEPTSTRQAGGVGALPTAAGGNAPLGVPSPSGASPFVPVTLEGVITDVRGSVFDLAAPDGAFLVQIDAKTVVTGDIVPGASAIVEGTQVAQNRVLAVRVTVVASPPAPHAGSESTPTPSAPPGHVDPSPTPVGPEPTQTQPGKPATTKTPGPPITRTPGPPSMLPTQAGGSDGSPGGPGGGNSQ